MWDANTGKELLCSPNFDAHVDCVCLSRSGKFIAAGAGCGVFLLDINTNLVLAMSMTKEDEFIRFVYLTHEDNYLLYNDGTYVTVCNFSKCLDPSYIQNIVELKEVNGDDYKHKLLLTSSLIFISNFKAKKFQINSEKNIIVYSKGNKLRLKHFKEESEFIQIITGSNIEVIDLSYDSTLVATINSNNSINIWDYSSRCHINSFYAKGAIKSLKFSHDSQTIAAASELGLVYFWMIDSGNIPKSDYEEVCHNQVKQTFRVGFTVNQCLLPRRFISSFRAIKRFSRNAKISTGFTNISCLCSVIQHLPYG